MGGAEKDGVAGLNNRTGGGLTPSCQGAATATCGAEKDGKGGVAVTSTT